ncbi:hypothetical protein BDF14DRAFT_1820712 [Spinellus fusiger]|nr:hypothetical protein BDF14DRAFT_1820712 [Spinellus fusiger]
MLKCIADELPMTTMETLQHCKVFLLHGAGNIQSSFVYLFLPCLLHHLITLRENIYLWGLRFEPKGLIFELWLENTLYTKPGIDDKLDALPRFLKFFWSMKVFV